jgi:stage II sporulation protein D
VAKDKWFVIQARDANGLYVLKVDLGGKKTYRGSTLWSGVLGASYVRSPCYWISYNADKDTFTFKSHGYGGCVGFSQKGAGEYAKQGKDYIWILQHFYTGVTVK